MLGQQTWSKMGQQRPAPAEQRQRAGQQTAAESEAMLGQQTWSKLGQQQPATQQQWQVAKPSSQPLVALHQRRQPSPKAPAETEQQHPTR